MAKFVEKEVVPVAETPKELRWYKWLACITTVVLLVAVVFGIGFYRVEKNVPKNIPVKNEWFCIPSPQLQKQVDDSLLNMEVMVCARDKPIKR